MLHMTKDEVRELFDTHVRSHSKWARAAMSRTVPDWLTDVWAQIMLLVAADTVEYVDGDLGNDADGKLRGEFWVFTSRRLIRATVRFDAGHPLINVWAVPRSSLIRVEVARAWGGMEVWPLSGVQIRAQYPAESVILPFDYPSDDLEQRFHTFLPSLLADLHARP